MSSKPVNDFGDVFECPGLVAVQHHLLSLEVLVDLEGRRLLITPVPIAEMKVTGDKLSQPIRRLMAIH